MQNPDPEQMKQMIQAIFARTDAFRSHHKLEPPGDLAGFTELLRLVFSDDAAGTEIFSSFDNQLLEILWDMYQKRVLAEIK